MKVRTKKGAITLGRRKVEKKKKNSFFFFEKVSSSRSGLTPSASNTPLSPLVVCKLAAGTANQLCGCAHPTLSPLGSYSGSFGNGVSPGQAGFSCRQAHPLARCIGRLPYCRSPAAQWVVAKRRRVAKTFMQVNLGNRMGVMHSQFFL